MKTTQDTINELKAKVAELEQQLKEEQVEYPICCRSKQYGEVILFDGLKRKEK
jgi:ribosome-interacting GTPase 1